MWFKNLRIFRLGDAVTHDDHALQKALSRQAFQPCGHLDLVKQGWVSPLGRRNNTLSHTVANATIFCAKRQEKVLPSATINEALENKIFEIQEEEGRAVGRSERKSLKDEMIFTMLPRALTKSSLHFGYTDKKEHLAFINAASSKRAEDLLSLLRESLGSVKATPLTTHQPISQTLTEWLRSGQAPEPFALGEECELRAAKDERVVRLKKLDLSANEVSQHLETGMYVKQMALEWKDSIQFIINDELAIKRLRFSDELIDKADGGGSDTDDTQQFDNEFAIMSAELSALTCDVLRAFGGEDKTP